MEKIIDASAFIRSSMTPAEKKMFGVVKRELLKELVLPKSADRLMVDIVGCEYIKYARALRDDLPRIAISSAKSMREYLIELNLTPKSRTETNTSSTLSNIFKVLNNGRENA